MLGFGNLESVTSPSTAITSFELRALFLGLAGVDGSIRLYDM
jgi:hypothetical protein